MDLEGFREDRGCIAGPAAPEQEDAEPPELVALRDGGGRQRLQVVDLLLRRAELACPDGRQPERLLPAFARAETLGGPHGEQARLRRVGRRPGFREQLGG